MFVCYDKVLLLKLNMTIRQTIRQKSMVVEIKTNTVGMEWQAINTMN